jgi:hypothetical protein
MAETLQVTTTVTTLDISCNTVIDDDVKKADWCTEEKHNSHSLPPRS